MRSIAEMATEGAVYQQTQRWLATGCFEALVDDLRAPASAEDRGEVDRLVRIVQAVANDTVEHAWIDQGYTRERAANPAAEHGIALEVVKLPEAKRGFVLLPRRWVVEWSFAWATRFRRLVKDYERHAKTLAGLHVVAFACLMMRQAITLAAGHNCL